MNTKSLKLNGLISLLNKCISIICSLILPRLFITAYGSEINGLMSSISQYLNLISLLDLGMATVIQASLYKPILDGDFNQLSTIYYKSKVFFNRIGLALLVYIGCLCLILPQTLAGNVSNIQIIGLTLILSLSHLLQFFVGITSQIILGSDQRAYIKEVLQGTANIINLALSIFLINSGQSIYLVKFISSLVFILPPICISFYVHKHYKISKKNIDKDYKIQQQWYGIGQHIAYTIQESTDVVILSLFASLSQVSVYAVYNTVFQGIKTFLNAATSGLRPFLGRALHLGDTTILHEQFKKIEWTIHTAATILLSTTFQLITPFVILYTRRITDTNYNQPLFGYLMTLAIFIYALRLPYRTLVFSAGSFKETQVGTYSEAFLNLAISIGLVFHWQLIGVAIGTSISLLFSLFYYIWYCYRHILQAQLHHLKWQLLVDMLTASTSCLIFLPLTRWITNFMSWGLFGLCSVILTSGISYLLNRFILQKNILSIIK
ncbi:hypothetical protein HCC47_10890 [Streptococcus suis]|nr:hypothetical protein [Streptococcus suis]